MLLVGVGSGQLMAQQTLASETCGALSPFAALQQLIIAGLLPAECIGIPATALALNASIRTNVVDHFHHRQSKQYVPLSGLSRLVDLNGAHLATCERGRCVGSVYLDDGTALEIQLE